MTQGMLRSTREAARAIIAATAAQYHVSPDDVLGRARRAPVCRARRLAAWLMAEALALPDREIASILGCDRSTVTHHRQTVDEIRERDGLYRALTDQARARWTPAADAPPLRAPVGRNVVRAACAEAGRRLGRDIAALVRRRLAADPAGTLRLLADIIDPPGRPEDHDDIAIGGTD